MKKFILGIVVGLIVAAPVGVHAWEQWQTANPIIGFDCRNEIKVDDKGKYVRNPNGSNVYEQGCSGNVYVFDDQDNKCYIAKATGTAISCVKAK